MIIQHEDDRRRIIVSNAQESRTSIRPKKEDSIVVNKKTGIIVGVRRANANLFERDECVSNSVLYINVHKVA
jgi:hypothetical protein